MTDDARLGDEIESGGPYEVKATIWEVDYEADVDVAGEAERNERVVEGFYDEPSPIDAVNALLYELRGRKSTWELAYVDSIEEVS